MRFFLFAIYSCKLVPNLKWLAKELTILSKFDVSFTLVSGKSQRFLSSFAMSMKVFTKSQRQY